MQEPLKPFHPSEEELKQIVFGMKATQKRREEERARSAEQSKAMAEAMIKAFSIIEV